MMPTSTIAILLAITVTASILLGAWLHHLWVYQPGGVIFRLTAKNDALRQTIINMDVAEDLEEVKLPSVPAVNRHNDWLDAVIHAIPYIPKIDPVLRDELVCGYGQHIGMFPGADIKPGAECQPLLDSIDATISCLDKMTTRATEPMMSAINAFINKLNKNETEI